MEFEINHPLRNQKCRRCGSTMRPQMACCGSIYFFTCKTCGWLSALTDKMLKGLIDEYERERQNNP